MTKTLLFWLFIALDGAALGLVFLLGLAAAAPSHTHPLAVVAFFAVPALLLAALAFVFLRAPWPLARHGALVLAAMPVLVVLGGALLARGAAWTQGDPVPAWKQPDTAATPALVQALRDSHRTGAEPVLALLRAGVNPNDRGISGPNWFEAVTPGTDPAVLPALLQHEVDVRAVDIGGHTALYWAAWHRNWEAAALLVEYGAPVHDVPPDRGGSLQQMVDAALRDTPCDTSLLRLRSALQAASSR